MKLKFISLISTAGMLLFALPQGLRADTTSTATPAPTVGKKHIDVNQWLDKHPKIKTEVLEKFDANHNGVLDGDEIKPFLKWLKERQEKRKEDGGGKGGKAASQTTTTTPPAITSPTVQ